MSTDQLYITMEEMITQRGYNIINKDIDKIIGQNGDKKIAGFFEPIAQFNVKEVEKFVNVVKKMDIDRCIIVYTKKVTPMAQKVIDNSIDVTIELFTYDEMQFNITKHRLVPLHIKLSDIEGEEFKKKYGIKFPCILRTDAISRFYGYEKGNVIKIVRKDGQIAYRIVR